MELIQLKNNYSAYRCLFGFLCVYVVEFFVCVCSVSNPLFLSILTRSNIHI